MTPEEQLQQLLERSAGRVLVDDTDDAYGRVLELRRRHDARRQTVYAVLGAVLVAAIGLGFLLRDVVDLNGSAGPADHGVKTTRHPTDTTFVPGADAGLVGEWQTEVIEAAEVKTALAAEGFSPAAADRVLHGDERWIVQLTFSGSLVVNTWDPARPAASLRIGPTLTIRELGDGRLVMTLPHPTTQWYFTYRLTGDRLDLHYVRSTGRPSPYTARLIAWTIAPARLS